MHRPITTPRASSWPHKPLEARTTPSDAEDVSQNGNHASSSTHRHGFVSARHAQPTAPASRTFQRVPRLASRGGITAFNFKKCTNARQARMACPDGDRRAGRRTHCTPASTEFASVTAHTLLSHVAPHLSSSCCLLSSTQIPARCPLSFSIEIHFILINRVCLCFRERKSESRE